MTQFMVSLDDGTIAEQAALSRPGATKKINATLRDGNVSQIAQASVSAYAGLGPVKVAVGFKLNDTNTVFAVEALTATDTSCTMPTPNTLVFCNQSATGSSSLSGWLLEAMYLPTRLTDAQLADGDIMKDFMYAAIDKDTWREVAIAQGVAHAETDPETGMLALVYNEGFHADHIGAIPPDTRFHVNLACSRRRCRA